MVKKAQKVERHEKYVGDTYGLRAGEYEQILYSQGCVCAMCGIANGKTKALAVDHDHKLEEEFGIRASVRGILCGRCNYNILGQLGDDPATYEAIAEYLRNPPARRILDE